MVFLREEVLGLGHYRCRALIHDAPGLPIVFLHGYSFTSDVWRDIGVLEYLERENIPYLAIDMPYGARSSCSPHTRDPDENVFVLHEAVHGVFGTIRPVIVGASLGGYIALRYCLEHPVSGLLLIGPVRVFEEDLVRRYSGFNYPVHIIVGTRDRIVNVEDMEKLAKLIPNAKLKIYEDAGHPAYLDYPGRFRNDLLELYREVLKG